MNADIADQPSLLHRLGRAILTLEWVFLILLLPVVLTLSPRTLPLLLIIPFLWGVRRLTVGYFVPPTPLNTSLVLLLVMVLVSLLVTAFMDLSLLKIAGVLHGVAVFFAVTSFVLGSPRRLWYGVVFFAGVGLALAIVAIFTTQWRGKLPVIGAVTQRLPPSLDIVNPNEIAGVLLWVAPLPLALLAAQILRLGALRRRLGPLAAPVLLMLTAIVAVVLAAVLILTQSRSGLLGFTSAVVFMGLVHLRRHRLLRLLIVILALAAALFLISGLLPQIGVRPGAFPALDSEAPADVTTLDMSGRLELWQRALYGIQDFPLTGMGMGAFRRVVHILYPLFTISPGTDIGHAHNQFLQTALDLGLPGLVAYLALWIGAAGMLWSAWREAPDPWLQALALGIAASMLATFIYGLTDAVALGARPGFIFWFLLGLAAATFRVVRQSAPVPS